MFILIKRVCVCTIQQCVGRCGYCVRVQPIDTNEIHWRVLGHWRQPPETNYLHIIRYNFQLGSSPNGARSASMPRTHNSFCLWICLHWLQYVRLRCGEHRPARHPEAKEAKHLQNEEIFVFARAKEFCFGSVRIEWFRWCVAVVVIEAKFIALYQRDNYDTPSSKPATHSMHTQQLIVWFKQKSTVTACRRVVKWIGHAHTAATSTTNIDYTSTQFVRVQALGFVAHRSRCR